MRAIVVELSGADDAWARGVVDALAAGRIETSVPASPAEGMLVRPDPSPDDHDRSQGEPW
jgi:hypothetical protein